MKSARQSVADFRRNEQKLRGMKECNNFFEKTFRTLKMCKIRKHVLAASNNDVEAEIPPP